MTNLIFLTANFSMNCVIQEIEGKPGKMSLSKCKSCSSETILNETNCFSPLVFSDLSDFELVAEVFKCFCGLVQKALRKEYVEGLKSAYRHYGKSVCLLWPTLCDVCRRLK